MLSKLWKKVPQAQRDREETKQKKDFAAHRKKMEAYRKTINPLKHELTVLQFKKDLVVKKIQKKIVDPDKPKPPKSAYQVFFTSNLGPMMKVNPGMTLGAVTKVMNQRWMNSLTEAEKNLFLEESNRQKEETKDELSNYEKSEKYHRFLVEKKKREDELQAELKEIELHIIDAKWNVKNFGKKGFLMRSRKRLREEKRRTPSKPTPKKTPRKRGRRDVHDDGPKPKAEKVKKERTGPPRALVLPKKTCSNHLLRREQAKECGVHDERLVC